MMKALLVGFAALFSVILLTGLGYLLLPILLMLSVVIRIVLSIVILFFGVWCLGKFLIWAWRALTC